MSAKNVEELLEALKAEAVRNIRAAKTYDSRIAWYWTHIGEIEMARQLGLINEDRRYELEVDFRAYKPKADEQPTTA